MWKYLNIASLVLLAVAGYVFYKTHTGVTSSQGEVASLQAQVADAVDKNKEVFIDKAISAYGKFRTAWLQQRKADMLAQKEEFERRTAQYKDEYEHLHAEWMSLEGELNEQKKKLQSVLTGLATEENLLKALETAKENRNIEVLEMDPSSPSDMLDALSANMVTLRNERIALSEENTKDEAAIDDLSQRSEDLAKKITAAETLMRERQARISPKELNCRVVVAEPDWKYVIVNGGIDKGVIIGSRLAVVRNDRKICELAVTLVEETRSSCDVVRGTMVAGETVHVGDRVIAVRNDNVR